MTTTPAPSINVITPTGSAVGPWTTGWKFDAPEDVWIYVETDGVAGPDLELGSDFTLSAPNPSVDGGSVTLDASIVPEDGWDEDLHRVVIRRWTVRRQGIALPDTEGHKPRATERALDRQMRIAEEQDDEIARLAEGGGVAEAVAAAATAFDYSPLIAPAVESVVTPLLDERVKTDGTSSISAPGLLRISQNLFEVHVKDFGAPINGTSNASAAFQDAAEAVSNNGAGGGQVRFDGPYSYFLGDGWDILPNVYGYGGQIKPDIPGLASTDANDVFLRPALVLPTDASIRRFGSSALTHFFLKREGMTACESDSAAYDGDAVITYGMGSTMSHGLIVGFAMANDSNGFDRDTISDMLIDTTAGLRSYNALDVPRWNSIQGFPVGTIAHPVLNASRGPDHGLFRNGVMFDWEGVNDWFSMSDSFEIGHLITARINGARLIILDNVQGDCLPFDGQFNGVGGTVVPYPDPYFEPTDPTKNYVVAGSIGLKIEGSVTQEVRIQNCQFAARETAAHVSGAAGQKIVMAGFTAHGIYDRGVVVDGPDVVLTNGWVRGPVGATGLFGGLWIPTGDEIGVEVVSGRVTMDRSFAVQDFATAVDGCDVEGGVIGMARIINGEVVNVAPPRYDVDGAGAVQADWNYDSQVLYGSPGYIGAIGPTFAGHRVMFLIDDTTSLLDGPSLAMREGVDYAAGPGHWWLAECDGTGWFEIARFDNTGLSGGGGGTTVGTDVFARPPDATPSTTATPQPIIWSTEVRDANNNFDHTTGVYNCTSSELVYVEALLALSAADATSGRMNMILLKGSGGSDTELDRQQIVVASTLSQTLKVSAFVFMEPGETLHCSYFNDRATAWIGSVSRFQVTALRAG